MKTLVKLTLVAALLGAAALPLTVIAADAASVGKDHPRLRQLMQRRHAIAHRIAHRLGLSADQTGELKAIRAKTRASLQAIRGDAALTPDQKKAKARETLQAARPQMRAVLTADQQAQLGQLRARFQHLRQRRFGG